MRKSQQVGLLVFIWRQRVHTGGGLKENTTRCRGAVSGAMSNIFNYMRSVNCAKSPSKDTCVGKINLNYFFGGYPPTHPCVCKTAKSQLLVCVCDESRLYKSRFSFLCEMIDKFQSVCTLCACDPKEIT